MSTLVPATELAVRFPVHGEVRPRSAAERAAIMERLSFGIDFTDHMARAVHTRGEGWHDLELVPFGPIQLSPATSVLHYGQEVFEGLKAYRRADGSVWLFRPEANAARMVSSAKRLALPPLPEEDFLTSIRQLVELDERWVSGAAELLVSAPRLG